MNFEYLQDLIKKLKDKNGKFNSQKIKDNPDIFNELNQYEFLSEFETKIEKLFAIDNKLEKRPRCVCGKLTNYVKNLKQYKQYCSRSCPEMRKILQEKREKSNLKKYGIKYTSSLKETREKVKQSFLSNYGVENPNQNKEVLLKRKSTNLKRYGFESALKNKEVRNKARLTNLNKFILIYLPIKLNKIKELYNIIPYEWELRDYTVGNREYQFQHINCGKIFSFNLNDGRIPSCPKCHRLWNNSKVELKLRNDLINTFGEKYIDYNNREIIKPLELDIVIDNKLAIEVNGTYWHQEYNKKISLLSKSNISPIQILHFWDFELENKYDICKSIIFSKLNIYKERIFARKCKYQNVDEKEANQFFKNNHLQGSTNAVLNYGLYYNDELIQCISIGKSRFNKNFKYEIHRLASKKNVIVLGGVTKLFSKIKKELLWESLITYADKRYSNGNIYRQLGFSEMEDSKPNYFWRKNNTILSRYQTQKHKLSQVLNDFDSNLSETDNMLNNGYHKFKDCGNKVFHITL